MASIIVPLLLASIVMLADGLGVEQKQSTNLILIGRVGTKQFFAGDIEYTWYEARELCITHGMDLVDIQSMEEVTFLNNTLAERGEFSHYWTSAKEKYVFETTNTVFDPQFGDIDYFGTPLCLSIRIPDDKTQWDVRMCSEAWPALCQRQVV